MHFISLVKKYLLSEYYQRSARNKILRKENNDATISKNEKDTTRPTKTNKLATTVSKINREMSTLPRK